MTQCRLNYLMILHVHKEMTDSLELANCANDFVGSNEHHLSVFGNFTELMFSQPNYCSSITRLHEKEVL